MRMAGQGSPPAKPALGLNILPIPQPQETPYEDPDQEYHYPRANTASEAFRCPLIK